MSPALVIQQMLVDLELASNDEAASNNAARAFVGFLPVDPNTAICVYDTAGMEDGRLMETGEKIVHPGIQVMVRGQHYLETRNLAHQIALALDAQRKTVVVVSGVGNYIIHNVSRTGDIMSLGLEVEGDRRRHYFAINAVITINETT